MRIARENGVPIVNPVDAEGRFDDRVLAYAGQWVREADRASSRTSGPPASSCGRHVHPHVPFLLAMRHAAPVLRPSSWYVRTTARKEDLLAANEQVIWYPDHIKRGRYGDWLRNNVDWSLSRERYWAPRCRSGDAPASTTRSSAPSQS